MKSGLTLSSEDTVGLHDMLQQCGLLAVAAQEEAEAAGGTEGKATQGRSLRCHGQISQGEGRSGKPGPCKQTSSQCSLHPEAYAIPRGRKRQGGREERWGWVVAKGRRNTGGFSLRGCPPTRLPGPGSRAHRKHPPGHPLAAQQSGSGCSDAGSSSIGPPSQGGMRSHLLFLILFSVFAVAQGSMATDYLTGPTDDTRMLQHRLQRHPVPIQQLHASTTAAPPLRGKQHPREDGTDPF